MYRDLTFAGVALLLALAGVTQPSPRLIDADHSYAGLWFGRETETTHIVNTGVARVGGHVRMDPADPAESSLTFTLVPGGEGVELLDSDGSLRPDIFAHLMRYTVMTFDTRRARVRPDGYLEFSGELGLTHVTREQIRPAWNSTYTDPSYTDPEISRAAGSVNFVLATPRAEFLAGYLQKNRDLLVSATVTDAEFEELPQFLLDSYWPTFAQDAECPTVNPSLGVRDNISLLCHGQVISVVPSLQRAQTSGVDYSGLRKNDTPVNGPVTILLHLKLTGQAPAAALLPESALTSLPGTHVRLARENADEIEWHTLTSRAYFRALSGDSAGYSRALSAADRPVSWRSPRAGHLVAAKFRIQRGGKSGAASLREHPAVDHLRPGRCRR